jgi:hypothetical protein
MSTDAFHFSLANTGLDDATREQAAEPVQNV